MNLIFDFDGTICDSFDITLNIVNEYLNTHHKKTVNAKRFKEEGIEKVIKKYKLNKLQILLFIYLGRRRLSKYIPNLKTFDSLPEVIKTLSKSNTLGIVSTNSKKNIIKFLENNDLDKYFKFVATTPNIFNKARVIKNEIKKYKLQKDETIYIGDEVRDIQAAARLNIKCISVSWGFASKNLLINSGAQKLVSDPKELLSVEKQLQH